jgi:hypothetical protein
MARQVHPDSACWFGRVLMGVCACLAALQGGQAGAGGHWGAVVAVAVISRVTPQVKPDGAAGMPRYNAIDAEEGGRGNGLSRREA